jgi:hypothetical protein
MKRAPTKPIPLDRCFELFYVDSTSPSGLRNAVSRHISPRGRMAGWRVSNRRKTYTFHMVYIDGKTYPSHRVVYAMMTGKATPLEVDHIDRDPLNNHPFNLREASRSEQCLNKVHPNATGNYRGVLRWGSKWSYEIRRRSQGIRIYQGGFMTEREAWLAREARLATMRSDEERTL